ncbi:MAG TPA: prepilin peptidase [Roseiarcus sp.]|nr:prepilin peptidase [Roseiarcus sp.]
MLNLVLLAFFPGMMALAASMDLLTMTIPNRVSSALVLAYFALAIALRAPPQDVLLNVSCAAAVLSAMFLMFSLGWIGGGDAKLAAATALWLGWASIFDYGVMAALCGGVLTLVLLALRFTTLPGFLERRAWLARLKEKSVGVPYGVALAAAGLIQIPHTKIWASALA